MNMTDIQCFIKVTELMSFTKAAEALYTSQQAVSLHIKHLENTYKVQLFERKPSLKLTTSGQALLEAARDIIERENRLINQFLQCRMILWARLSLDYRQTDLLLSSVSLSHTFPGNILT